MRTLFLTSSGLNEKTMVLFWKCIGKEPINTKAILVPSAAVGNDGAREGIIVCMERLMNMGIPMNNILIYNNTTFHAFIYYISRQNPQKPVEKWYYLVIMQYQEG